MGKRVFIVLVVCLAAVMQISAATSVSGSSALVSGFSSGGEYQLTQNITLSANLVVGSKKTVSLDLNGYTVSLNGYTMRVPAGTALSVFSSVEGGALDGYISGNNSTGNKDTPMVSIETGATMTLGAGATIGASSNDGKNFDGKATIACNGTLNVDGGNIVAGDGNSNGIWGAVYIKAGKDTGDAAVINILSGTVSGALIADESTTINISGGTVNGDISANDTSQISISGGTINGALSENSSGSLNITGGAFTQDPSAFIDGGKSVVYDNGAYFVDITEVARIGNVNYISISAALTAANPGDTITVTAPVSLGTGGLTVDKNVAIDLGGRTVTGDLTAADGITVTIKDTVGTGKLVGALNAGASGTYVIEGGRFTSNPTAYLASGMFAKYDVEGSYYTITNPSNSASLTLEGDIGMNFFIDVSAYTDDSDAYIVLEHTRLITVKGENLPETETISVGSAATESGTGRTKITVKVGPVQTINSVTVRLYDNPTDKTLLYELEDYTVADFCRSVVNNSASYQTDFVGLCTALLNYGSAVQTYFSAQPSNLPNAGLNIASLITSVDTSTWGTDYGTFSDGLPEYTGTSLVCNTNMVVRHYFADPIDDYSVAFVSGPAGSSMAISTGENNTGYYVEVGGVESSFLDTSYTIRITDTAAAQYWDITYSPMCYARKVAARSGNTNLVNLCKAIYLYGEAAAAYFTAI